MDAIGTLIILSLLAAFAQAQPSKAQLPAGESSISARQPTGQWVVDFDDTMCVMQRDYGTKADPLVLATRPSPLGEDITLYVLEKRRGSGVKSFDATIGFNDRAQNVTANMQSGDLTSGIGRLNLVTIKRIELDRAIASRTLTIHGGDELIVTFAVPQLKEALGVLDHCVADLLVDWGFSLADQKRLASAAVPLGAIVTANDYPSSAIDRMESGRNAARVTVDARGNPSKCVVVEKSGSEALDQGTCRVLMKANFSPARDKSGAAMSSPYFIRLDWRVE